MYRRVKNKTSLLCRTRKHACIHSTVEGTGGGEEQSTKEKSRMKTVGITVSKEGEKQRNINNIMWFWTCGFECYIQCTKLQS